MVKVIWKSKKKSWKWIAIKTMPLNKPLMFRVNRSGQNTQWFAFINVFPFAMTKNNSYMLIGFSFVKYFVGIMIHWDWVIKKRKKLQKDIKIDLF